MLILLVNDKPVLPEAHIRRKVPTCLPADQQMSMLGAPPNVVEFTAMPPDFLIIGAARSGTTSLFYYLSQHPDLFLPNEKELNYFSYEPAEPINLVGPGTGPGDNYSTCWTTSQCEYLKHFRKRRFGQLCGEASVSYLYSPITAERLAELCPNGNGTFGTYADVPITQ